MNAAEALKITHSAVVENGSLQEMIERKIRISARKGKRFVSIDDRMSSQIASKMKKIFKTNGFKVKKIEEPDIFDTYYLEISW